MSSDNVRIGTSGFSYRDWLGNFYPQFCPQADFLRYYSSQFKTVEIDMTFYRLPTADMVKRWAKVTPDGFVFTAKFPRMVTHEGTLEDRLAAARSFVEVMSHLGDKLGPLLLQFPYSFKPDQIDMLKAIVESLPPGGQFAVEVRNRRWLEVDEMLELLTARGISLCLVDHPWMPRVNVQTGGFQYIRFLGDQRKIESDFSYVRDGREDDLTWWGDLITGYARNGVTCYVYFNNHFSGHAPTTASRLQQLIDQA
ncbi:MAG: DUF72 domain-containing protein [Candidatus Zixiibacteriota bacterium]|nr:MAG: DUF72 domain-containing protein [candidate division Zixibacteria bacterium]